MDFKNSIRIYAIVIMVIGLCLFGCGDSSNEFRYVAIGASDAIGIGATPLSNGYVFQIKNRFEENCSSINQDVELFNLGIPAAELDEIENVEIPAAIELEPELITIWTGGNDIVGGRSVEVFRNDLRDVLETLSKETSARIVIGNLPALEMLPRFTENPNEDVTTERVNAFNTVIHEEASRVGGVLVDLSKIEITDILVSEDGFHPSDEGHGEIADRFLSSILESLCT